ncbi:hypothetical protein DW928_00150 [Firmicutes bacterium AM43-11BH]|nr:hypothetical protein DW928_00150 [Firmicutes bacterium AM43-11BH]
MESNDHGLLYDAAVAWKELTEYYYVFTFGYKQQLYTIHLSFPPEKFPHLAEFFLNRKKSGIVYKCTTRMK